MALENIPRTIWWEDGKVMLVDQTRLPLVGDVLVCSSYKHLCTAIKTLAVRGAPALGVAGALGLALWMTEESWDLFDDREFLRSLDLAAQEIVATRPTAANLTWGVERIRHLVMDNRKLPVDDLRDLMLKEALAMQDEDEARNRAIGANGAELLAENTSVLTHCNAGSLATAYYGTALGVVYTAHEQGKIERVWVDETRPVLQGARLTAWELRVADIPATLIVDGAAAAVMKAGEVDAVIVGADRIAANGDVANKIGTYGLAVLAHEHKIPFYVAAPTSSIDLTIASGEEIEVEVRDPAEVAGVTASGIFEPDSKEACQAFDSLTESGSYTMPMTRGHQMQLSRKGGGYQFDGWFQVAPPGVEIFNPAFDLTPAKYITAIITENGVARPEYGESLAEVCKGAGALDELRAK
ncbi:MAG: S-methyl-5-thioribose-1-phosphate isomerase [Coriobacteriia bacterium]|jgi:methylthioribose-1-phosphate isomerase|nr:S-methyl-5-thioribose-1-phosphate isomerase [Coriobacteriia bacterium]